MGRFCKFCGNPVEDGKECNCEGAVKERQDMAEASAAIEVSSATVNMTTEEVNTAEGTPEASVDNTENVKKTVEVNLQKTPENNAANAQETLENNVANVQETPENNAANAQETLVNNVANVQETPENNVANAQETLVNNVPPVPVQNASNGQEQAGANKSMNVDVAKILTEALGVTKSFLLNPFSAMKSAFAENNKQSQFVVGGISAFIMFVLFIIMFNNPLFSAFTMFKIAFGLILSYIFVKAVYSLGVFVFAKKQTKPVSYLSVLGLCSLTTIFDMIIIFLAVIFSSLSIGLFSSICLAFMFVNNIISAVVIAYIAFEENFVKTYRVSLLLQLILICIVMLLLQAVANSILSSFFSGMPGGMNGLDMFGNIY